MVVVFLGNRELQSAKAMSERLVCGSSAGAREGVCLMYLVIASSLYLSWYLHRRGRGGKGESSMTGIAIAVPFLKGKLVGFSNGFHRAVIRPNSCAFSRVYAAFSGLHSSSHCVAVQAISVRSPPAPNSIRHLGVVRRFSIRVQGRKCYAGTQTAAASSDVMKAAKPSTKDSIIKELEHALGSPLDHRPQAPAQKPLVVVISGPSGVGKDAVIKRLQEVKSDIHFVVTATSRPRRPGEVEGKDYYFVTKPEFQGMIARDELLEHAVVYGDYKGIPKKQVQKSISEGKDVLLRLDVQGAATVRQILGQNAVFIFMVAESELALVQRLVERKTESLDKLLIRIATARDEVKLMSDFDYVVVNADGQLEHTVSDLCSIIDAEKARVHQRSAQL